jgi:hypothetical protein
VLSGTPLRFASSYRDEPDFRIASRMVSLIFVMDMMIHRSLRIDKY